jgi:hypothetical protein
MGYPVNRNNRKCWDGIPVALHNSIERRDRNKKHEHAVVDSELLVMIIALINLMDIKYTILTVLGSLAFLLIAYTFN